MIKLPKKIRDLKDNKPHFFWIGFGVIAVILIDTTYSVILESIVHSQTNRSSFGDYHNAINTLFTGLALVFVAYGVYVQHKENKQRDEEKKCDDAKRDEEIKEAQSARLLDNFQGRFFEMLKYTTQAQDDVFYSGNRDFTGLRALGLFFDSVVTNSRIDYQGYKHVISLRDSKLQTKYNQIHDGEEDAFNRYMELLYSIFSFIDNSAITEKQKHEFADIVKSRLTKKINFLLLAYATTEKGIHLKLLAEQYSLFEKLPSDVEIRGKEIFNPLAFNSALRSRPLTSSED